MAAFPILRLLGLAQGALFLAAFLCCSVEIGLGHGPVSSPQGQQAPPTNGKSKLGSSQESKKKDERLHLHGVLVEGGAECQRFRADNGTFYALEGDLHGLRTGDRVKITAEIPRVSHCMQDKPLRLISIERVNRS